MKRFLYWLPALLWMGVIFIFSAQTKATLPNFAMFDLVLKKAGHFLGYALLALFLWWAVKGEAQFELKQLAWALLLAILYAASDEFHQSFVAGRGASVWDVLLDAVGATTSLTLLWARFRLRAAPSQTPNE